MAVLSGFFAYYSISFRWWGGLGKEGFMQAWFGCDVLQHFEDLRCVEFYFCYKALYIYIYMI